MARFGRRYSGWKLIVVVTLAATANSLQCFSDAFPIRATLTRKPAARTVLSVATEASIPVEKTQTKIVEATDDTPAGHSKQKPWTRRIEPVNVFTLSPKERNHLAGAMSYIAKHDRLLSIGFQTLSSSSARGGSTDWTEFVRSQLDFAGVVPEILRLVTQPGSQPQHVTVGVELVSVDSDTGKRSLKRTELIQAGTERIAFLILEDLRNVRDGIYEIPSEVRQELSLSPNPSKLASFWGENLLGRSLYMGNPDYETDSTASERLQELAQGLDLPDYYLHDFHSIPGGFLCPRHVQAYDSVSESVFRGTHRMARRMLLRPIWNHLEERSLDSRTPLKLLDVGTGTGSFLLQVRQAFSANQLLLYGLDLSPAMVEFAQRSIRNHKAMEVRQGNMEDIPAVDNYFDIVTQTNCFHEMPESALRATAREIARVLQPGGLFLHMDAVQFVDDAAIASTSRVSFDGLFVEPFMWDWMTTVDMDDIFASVGLVPDGPPKPYFASTLRCYRKLDARK